MKAGDLAPGSVCQSGQRVYEIVAQRPGMTSVRERRSRLVRIESKGVEFVASKGRISVITPTAEVELLS